jgi:hypothetical protein
MNERTEAYSKPLRTLVAFPILVGIISLTVMSYAPNSLAGSACLPPNVFGVQECVAGIEFTRVISVAAQQHKDEWCWAATISMLFDFYGHKISQEDIVRLAYGSLADMPAQPTQLTNALNKTWTDGTGSFAVATIKVFDIQDMIANMNSRDIITALSNGQPVVIGAEGHAMLLTAIKYILMPNGLNPITYAGVLDPWYGTARQLDPAHSLAQYAAIVSVTNDANQSPAAGERNRQNPTGSDRCKERYNTCIHDVRSIDSCVEEEYPAKCIDTCMNSYGLSRSECEQIRCRPTPTNLEGWRRRCSVLIDDDKDKCSDKRDECRGESSD